MTHDNDIYRRTLSSGTLTVVPADGGVALDALFDIAERRNPKRAFLFVSKVLGRHIPVSPATMRGVYRQLAGRIPADLPSPLLFIGMAETAVGLGAGVFQTARAAYPDSVYLSSTRHPVDGELLCEFKENHSHATDHLIYRPADAQMRSRAENARTLVLIDDEATTGNTFINLLDALRQAGLTQVERVVVVTLTDWSGDGIAQRCPLPVTTISLVQGSWHWEPDPQAPLPQMPAVNVTARGGVAITGAQCWGRLGMTESDVTFGAWLHMEPGERVLVLGSGEFVWQPFLLAERLERLGTQVRFSCTTRSPIAEGYAIASAISFADNYGLGIPNFLYNVTHQSFDRVLLCIETPEESVDPALLAQLRRVAPRVEVITCE